MGPNDRRPYHLYANALLGTAALLLIGIGGSKLLRKPKPPPALLTRRISEVALQGAPLDEALKQLARQAGVRIVIDSASLDQLTSDWRSPVELHLHDVELGQVMRLICTNRNIAIEEENGAVRVTSYAVLPCTVRVYDLRDLINPWPAESVEVPKRRSNACWTLPSAREETMDELVRLVEAVVRPEEWADNGGTDVLKSAGGWLIVSGPPPLHREVQKLLTDLRRNDRKPVALKAPVKNSE